MTRAASLATVDAATVRTARSAEQIYERIKTMAMTYAIRPGERINEVELARSLNMSRTPVREALNRLLMEGFLTRAPNKGFIGRHLDAKQVYDLFEYRRVLESGIVQLACERATPEELRTLEAFLKTSRERPEDSDASALLALDERFHEQLAALSRNQEMMRALEAVNARIHYFRWIDMRNGRRRYTQAEHLRIVKALKARNAAQAAQLVSEHIARRLDQVVEVIRVGYAEIYMRASEGSGP